MKENIIGAVALVALVLGLYTAVHVPAVPSTTSFGATTGMHLEDYIPYVRSNGGTYTELPVRIGASGTDVSQHQKGTCALIMSSYVALAATTTLKADCAITGVVSGDVVFAQFASSTNSVQPYNAGWLVTGASASTTSGFITLTIVNNTGAATFIPISIASSTSYLIER